MRKIYVLAIALIGLMVCSSAFAMEYNKNRMTSEQRVERLTTMLELTPEQQVKVRDIIQRRDKEMQQLFESLSKANDKEEQREIKLEILEQHRKYRKEFNSVLTNAQQMKYEEFIQRRIQERKMRGKS